MKKMAIILFLNFLSAYSQKVSFNLYLEDKCSNVIESCYFYSLEKDGKDYFPVVGETLQLPEMGLYKLYSIETQEFYNIRIDKLVNSDTIIKPTIEVQIPAPCVASEDSNKAPLNNDQVRKMQIDYPQAIKYFVCNKECNGYQVDYYSNGNLRTSGTFKNGIAIGELKGFYSNGNIQTIHLYDKDGRVKKRIQYDENGIEIGKIEIND